MSVARRSEQCEIGKLFCPCRHSVIAMSISEANESNAHYSDIHLLLFDIQKIESETLFIDALDKWPNCDWL